MSDIFSYLRAFRHLSRLPDSDGELLQRFRLQRDEMAFATLVERHGPMVLGVVQRLLGQHHLIDDVFQATFLVLARRGRHLETWPSVAGWLVQVARRTALQAKAKAARRTRHERQTAAMTPPSPSNEPAQAAGQRDLAEQLDAELARLPSKYSTPLVLCHLEGQTKEETARQLGWPVGSVSGRLARGKKLLQARLLRRGIVPAVAAGVLDSPAAQAQVSHLLVQATTLLASHVVHQTSKVSTSAAIVLAQGVMTSMFLTKVKYAAAVLVMMALCVGTGVWAWPGQGEQKQALEQGPKIETKAASLLEHMQGVWVVEKSSLSVSAAMKQDAIDRYRCWKFTSTKPSIPDACVVHFSSDIRFQETLFIKPVQINDDTSLATISFDQLSGIVKCVDSKLYLNLVAVSDKQAQPRDFEEGDYRWTITLRRATDYDRLEGIWQKIQHNPVTDELTYAEELIFRKNYYVRRSYTPSKLPSRPGSITMQHEGQPEKFELHETLRPKGIDFDIKGKDYLNQQAAMRLKAKLNVEELLPERRLGIYELSDNEFKYVMSSAVAFEMIDGQILPNTKAPGVRRDSSFEKASNPMEVYKRSLTSLKGIADIRKAGGPPSTVADVESGGRSESKPSSNEPSPRLLELRQQRLKLAQERMKLWQEEYQAGKPGSSMDELGTIAQQLLDAKLALADTKQSSALAMEENLKTLKQIEEVMEQKYQAGSATRSQFLATQLRRIEFAIQLEEIKQKP